MIDVLFQIVLRFIENTADNTAFRLTEPTPIQSASRALNQKKAWFGPELRQIQWSTVKFEFKSRQLCRRKLDMLLRSPRYIFGKILRLTWFIFNTIAPTTIPSLLITERLNAGLSP